MGQKQITAILNSRNTDHSGCRLVTGSKVFCLNSENQSVNRVKPQANFSQIQHLKPVLRRASALPSESSM